MTVETARITVETTHGNGNSNRPLIDHRHFGRASAGFLDKGIAWTGSEIGAVNRHSSRERRAGAARCE
jgi:hypothetical protein